MIYCRAHVEVIKPATPHRLGSFEVHVLGQEPNDFVRVYRISHKSEDEAAREGIDRFVEEIGSLVSEQQTTRVD